MKYYYRYLENTLEKYLSLFPAIAITGPRQSGKSTLLLHLLKDTYTYVSFDDYRIINLFYDDPEKFMKIYSTKVIFDEIQKVPEIFNYLKIAIDNDRDNYGNFILSGSSQFSLLSKITESLAGRIGLLSLLPFQYLEIPDKLRDVSIFKGCYPELIKRDYLGWEEWFAAYLETYLHKDVRAIANIGDIRDFQKMINLLAARTSELLNMSTLANELGIAVTTVKKWISILEASYIIFLLPPYFNNLGKRIVKSPKLYFYDTGLVSFLTGVITQDLYEKGPMFGSIFENYIVSEIKKREMHNNTKAAMYFYRTSHGVEVDLIIDRKQSQEWFEIKASATFKPKMVQAMEGLLPEKTEGKLLYQGESLPYVKNIKILNYHDYFKR